MNLNEISGSDFGRSLKGMGLNLLVTDVERSAKFLCAVFGMKAFQPTKNFAIMTYGAEVFQLHHDSTFASHPLLGLVPETPPRGGGIEIRLFETDPDEAAAKVAQIGGHVLQAPSDKPPHGLRECVILDADGYAWVPSQPLDANT